MFGGGDDDLFDFVPDIDGDGDHDLLDFLIMDDILQEEEKETEGVSVINLRCPCFLGND